MILILGVTASGKGRLAFDLAQKLGAEIISVDSMKVYRRMDIGTAKPPPEARRQINYHLIDVVEPSESFSAGRFVEAANNAIDQAKSRHKPVIAVGGTALYVKALLYGLFEGPPSNQTLRRQLKTTAQAEGLESLHRRLARIDPDAAARIHPNDEKRIIRALEVYEITGRPISSLQQQWNAEEPERKWTVIGLRRDKAEQNKRINARVKKMVAKGLVDEVRSLLAEDKPLSEQARSAIGYAEIIEHLAGRIDLEKAIEQIKINTRRLAKAQRTWFKTFRSINWLDIRPQETPRTILSRAEALLENQS